MSDQISQLSPRIGQKRPADPVNLTSNDFSKRFRYDQSCDSKYGRIDYKWPGNRHMEHPTQLHGHMPGSEEYMIPQTLYQQYNQMSFLLAPGYTTYNVDYKNMASPNQLGIQNHPYPLYHHTWPRIYHIEHPTQLHGFMPGNEKYVVSQTSYQRFNQMAALFAPGYGNYNFDYMNMVLPHQLGILHQPDQQHQLDPQNQPGPSHDKHNQPSPPHQLHKHNQPDPPYQQDSPYQICKQDQPGPPYQQEQPIELSQAHPGSPHHQEILNSCIESILNEKSTQEPAITIPNIAGQLKLGKLNQPDPPYQQDSPYQICKQDQPGPPYQQEQPIELSQAHPDSPHHQEILNSCTQSIPNEKSAQEPAITIHKIGGQLKLGKLNQPDPPYQQDSPYQLGKQDQPGPPYQQEQPIELSQAHPGSLHYQEILNSCTQSIPNKKSAQEPAITIPNIAGQLKLGKLNQPDPPYQQDSPYQVGKQDQPGPPYQQEEPIELSQAHHHHQEVLNSCTQNIPNEKSAHESAITIPNIAGLLLNDTMLNGFKRAIDRIISEIKPRIVDLSNDEVMSSLRQEVRDRIFQALMSQRDASINPFEIYWMYRNIHDANSDTELLYRVCGVKYITTTPEYDRKWCEIFRGPGSVSQGTLTRIEKAISTILKFHLRHLESINKPTVGKLKSIPFLVRDKMYNMIMNKPVASFNELLSGYAACHKITDCDHEVLSDDFSGKGQTLCANNYTHPPGDTIDDRSSEDRQAIFHGPKNASEQTLVLITRAALLLRTFQHIKHYRHRHILLEHFKKITEIEQMGFQWEILNRLYKHFAGRLVPSENEMCDWYSRYYSFNEDYKLILYIKKSPQFERSCVYMGLSGLNEAIIEIKKSIHASDLEKIQAAEYKIIKELVGINPTIVAFHNTTIRLLLRYRLYNMCKGKPVSSDFYQLYRQENDLKSDENLLSVVLRGETNCICADDGIYGTKDLQFPPEHVGDCLTVDTGQDQTYEMPSLTPITPFAVPTVKGFEDEIFNGPKTASKSVLLRIQTTVNKIVNGMKIGGDIIAHEKSVVQDRFYKMLMGLKVPTFKELLNMYQTHYHFENYNSACEAQNMEMDNSHCCTQEFSKPLTSNESTVTNHMVSVVTIKTNSVESDGTMNTECISSSEANDANLIESNKNSNIEIMLPDLNPILMEPDETIQTIPLSTPVNNALELISSHKPNDMELMELDGTRNKEPKAVDKTTKTKPMESDETNNTNMLTCDETIIIAGPKENVIPIFHGPKTAEKSALMRIDEAANKIIIHMKIDQSEIPQAKLKVLNRFYGMLIGYPVPSCQILLTAYERHYFYTNKSKLLKIPINEVSDSKHSSDERASNIVKTSEITYTDPIENKQQSSNETNLTSLARNVSMKCYTEPEIASILWHIESSTDTILIDLKKKHHLIKFQIVLARLEIRRRLYEICKRFSGLPTPGCLIHEYEVHYDMNNDNRLLEILQLNVSNPQASLNSQNEDIFPRYVPKSMTLLYLNQINMGVERVMKQLKVKGFPQILLASSIVYKRLYEIFIDIHLSIKKKRCKKMVSLYTAQYGVVLENDKGLCDILKMKFESDAPSETVTCSEMTSILPKEYILEISGRLLTAAHAIIANWKKCHPLAQHSQLIQLKLQVYKRLFYLRIDIQNAPSCEKLLNMYRERYTQDLHYSQLSHVELEPDIISNSLDLKSYKVMKATFAILKEMNIHHSGITNLDLTLMQWIVRDRVREIFMRKNYVPCECELMNFYKDNHTAESDSELVHYICLRTHSKKFATTYLRSLPSLILIDPNTPDSDKKIIEEEESKIMDYLKSNYKLCSQFNELFVKWVVCYRIYKIIKADPSAINQNLHTTFHRRYSKQSYKGLLGNLSKENIEKNQTREEGIIIASSVQKTSEPAVNINKEDQIMYKVSNLVINELNSLFNENSHVHSKKVSYHRRTENELIEERVHTAVWKNLHSILLSLENNLSSMIATNGQSCTPMEPEPPENTSNCSSCQLVKLSGVPKLPRLREIQEFVKKYNPTSYQMYTEVKDTIFIDIPQENDKHELIDMKDISIDGNSITVTLIPFSYLDIFKNKKERNSTGEQCRMDTANHCVATNTNRNVDQCNVDTDKKIIVLSSNKLYGKQIENNIKITVTCENRDEYNKHTDNHCDYDIRNDTIPNESALRNRIHTEELVSMTNENVGQCSMETEYNCDATRKKENGDQCIKQIENHYDSTATNYNVDECRTEPENHRVVTLTNEGSMETENHCDTTGIMEYGDKFHMKTEDHCVSIVTNENEGAFRMDNENKCFTTLKNVSEYKGTVDTENHYNATITNGNEVECRAETENQCIAMITNEDSNQCSIETENHCAATVTNDSDGVHGADYETNCITTIRNESESQCSIETENHCYVAIVELIENNINITSTCESRDEYNNHTENRCDDNIKNNTIPNEFVLQNSIHTEEFYVDTITNNYVAQCRMETENNFDATTAIENKDKFIKQSETQCDDTNTNNYGDGHSTEAEINIAMIINENTKQCCIITNESGSQCVKQTENYFDATVTNDNEDEYRIENENNCVSTITNGDANQCSIETENHFDGTDSETEHRPDTKNNYVAMIRNESADTCSMETENHCCATMTNENGNHCIKQVENRYDATVANDNGNDCTTETENSCVASITNEVAEQYNIEMENHRVSTSTYESGHLFVKQAENHFNATNDNRHVCRTKTENYVATVTNKDADQCNMETENCCGATVAYNNEDECRKNPVNYCVTTISNESADKCSMETDSNCVATWINENADQCVKKTENHRGASVTHPNGDVCGTENENTCVATIINKCAKKCIIEMKNGYDGTKRNENGEIYRMEIENYSDGTTTNDNGGDCTTDTENKCAAALTNEVAYLYSIETENHCDITVTKNNGDKCSMEAGFDTKGTSNNRGECRTVTGNTCFTTIANEIVGQCSIETENHHDDTVTQNNVDMYETETESNCVATIKNEDIDQCSMETESHCFAAMTNENADQSIKQTENHYDTTTKNETECRTEASNNCVAKLKNEGSDQSSIIENHRNVIFSNYSEGELGADTENNHLIMITNENENQCSMDSENVRVAEIKEHADQCVTENENYCVTMTTEDPGQARMETKNHCNVIFSNYSEGELGADTENNHLIMITNENENQCSMESENDRVAEIKENADQCGTENENCCVTMTTEDPGQARMEKKNHCNRTIINKNADEYVKDNKNHGATNMNEECKIAMKPCVATITKTGEFQRSIKTENLTVTSITSEDNIQDHGRIETENICVATITHKNYLGESGEDNITYSLDKIMDELDDQLNDLFTSLVESEDIVKTERY